MFPDLRDADLRDGDLKHADLFVADLKRADLKRVNLACADLSGANLTGANLFRADLSGADLTGVNLFRANLTSANLFRTTLSGANLTDANMSRARLSDIVFGRVDLTNAVGLETCWHQGPSIIDHQTIQKSGRLPPPFLRGVGLPDRLIEYLPSLFEQAIQYYSCFISYSSKDQDFADRIHADLQNSGVRCWFAPHDLPIGEKILDGLNAAIRVHDKVLLILSEHSIRSGWVEDEVTKAFEEERKRKQVVLFPVRLNDGVTDADEAWAAKLRARNIGDFRRWKDHDGYKRSFERVLHDLKMTTPATAT